MQNTFYEYASHLAATEEYEQAKRRARRLFWRDVGGFLLRIAGLGLIIYTGTLWASMGCPNVWG